MENVPENEGGAPLPRVWRRSEYVRLVDSGLLGDDDVELVDGSIFVKRRESPRHAAALGRVQQRIEQAFGDGWWVRVDRPIVLDETSMPDPDLAVVSGSPADYADRHPEHAVLVIEISDASRVFDLRQKQRMYARAGLPEYWCIDLQEDCVWVHRQPGSRGYKRILRCDRGDHIELAEPSPASTVAVDDLLLPPAG